MLVAAWLGVRTWAFSKAFLVDHGGFVVVYQGVPGEFAGITLDRFVRRTDVPVSVLRSDIAAQLRQPSGVEAKSMAEADSLVEQYRAQAAASMPATTPPGPGILATSSPSPGATTTAPGNP